MKNVVKEVPKRTIGGEEEDVHSDAISDDFDLLDDEHVVEKPLSPSLDTDNCSDTSSGAENKENTKDNWEMPETKNINQTSGSSSSAPAGPGFVFDAEKAKQYRFCVCFFSMQGTKSRAPGGIAGAQGQGVAQ